MPHSCFQVFSATRPSLPSQIRQVLADTQENQVSNRSPPLGLGPGLQGVGVSVCTLTLPEDTPEELAPSTPGKHDGNPGTAQHPAWPAHSEGVLFLLQPTASFLF